MARFLTFLCFGWLSCLTPPCLADPAVDASSGSDESRAAPRFEADTSQTPDLQPWGHAAEALCHVWYPRIVEILQSDDGVRPLPPLVEIVFEPRMRGVAFVRDTTMHISADWVRAQPHDFGMVVHELTHLVQRYPANEAGWLVEGMADYVRLKHFEPQLEAPRIDFATARYTDSYKTSALFLMWVADTYDPAIIPKLHTALREQRYSDALFKDYTGKDLEALWAKFAESQPVTQ